MPASKVGIPDLAQRLADNWQLPAACLSLAVIATLDVTQRAEFTVSAFYVVPVLLALWSQNNQHAIYLAYAATGLSVVGFMRSPLGGAHEDRKSTRLNSSHEFVSRMPSSA